MLIFVNVNVIANKTTLLNTNFTYSTGYLYILMSLNTLVTYYLLVSLNALFTYYLLESFNTLATFQHLFDNKVDSLSLFYQNNTNTYFNFPISLCCFEYHVLMSNDQLFFNVLHNECAHTSNSVISYSNVHDKLTGFSKFHSGQRHFSKF